MGDVRFGKMYQRVCICLFLLGVWGPLAISRLHIVGRFVLVKHSVYMKCQVFVQI